jgi:hypothetical protein
MSWNKVVSGTHREKDGAIVSTLYFSVSGRVIIGYKLDPTTLHIIPYINLQLHVDEDQK